MKIKTRFKIAKTLNIFKKRTRIIYDFIIFLFVLSRYLKGLFQKKNGILNDSQHYLPQFIQRRFEIKNIDKKSWVYVYYRGSKKPVSKPIKSVGEKINYYVSKNRFTKNLENTYDDIYKFLEDSVAPIIVKLDKCADVILNIEEQNIIAEFVASLYTRTPGFRSQTKHLILYLIEHKGMKLETLSNRKIFENIFINNSLRINWSEIQNYTPSNITDIYNAPNHLLVISSFVYQKINEQIFKKTLNILETKNSFVMADNPVVIIDLQNPLKWPPVWELNKKGVIIALPISPKRCIIYGFPDADLKLIHDEELYKIINDHSFYYAHDFIISDVFSEKIQHYFNGTRKLYNYSSEK